MTRARTALPRAKRPRPSPPASIQLSDGSTISVVVHAPEPAPGRAATGVGIVVGHGAGSNMDSPAVVATAKALAARGHTALRFNFPYREANKKIPDPKPKLEEAYRAAAEVLRAQPGVRRLVIGGRSMGGRIASMIAATGYACDGLVFFGYPLHPPNKKDALRDAHLPSVAAPMLFVQGTRDALCDLDLLRPVIARLGDRATLHIVEGGDHSLEVLKRSGRTKADVDAEVLGAIGAWLERAVVV